jgi:hypothetical protein
MVVISLFMVVIQQPAVVFAKNSGESVYRRENCNCNPVIVNKW